MILHFSLYFFIHLDAKTELDVNIKLNQIYRIIQPKLIGNRILLVEFLIQSVMASGAWRSRSQPGIASSEPEAKRWPGARHVRDVRTPLRTSDMHED